jgi:hypothetical protein
MLAGSVVALGATSGFLFGSESILGLLLANAALGAGHLACVISQQALVAKGSAASALDTMFGYCTFSASLGQAVGPLLISTLSGAAVRPETDRIFLAAAAMSAVLVVVALSAVPANTKPDHPRSAENGPGGIRQLLGPLAFSKPWPPAR